MSLPCFIINLKDSPQNFEKQRPFLIDQGLDPVRFIGVDARKDEHLDHKDILTEWCFKTCPKAVIGCSLSHVLLARHIRDLGIPVALVLEDDAYPNTDKLLQHVFDAIQETPEDWDIIKLHCFNCLDSTIISGPISGSTAAYLINTKGLQKLSEMKINNVIDVNMNLSNLIIYKSRYNLFWTDESFSTISNANSNWFVDFKIPFSAGERTISQHLTGKQFRIPNTSIELEIWVTCIISLISMYILYKMV